MYFFFFFFLSFHQFFNTFFDSFPFCFSVYLFVLLIFSFPRCSRFICLSVFCLLLLFFCLEFLLFFVWICFVCRLLISLYLIIFQHSLKFLHLNLFYPHTLNIYVVKQILFFRTCKNRFVKVIVDFLCCWTRYSWNFLMLVTNLSFYEHNF